MKAKNLKIGDTVYYKGGDPKNKVMKEGERMTVKRMGVYSLFDASCESQEDKSLSDLFIAKYLTKKNPSKIKKEKEVDAETIPLSAGDLVPGRYKMMEFEYVVIPAFVGRGVVETQGANRLIALNDDGGPEEDLTDSFNFDNQDSKPLTLVEKY